MTLSVPTAWLYLAACGVVFFWYYRLIRWMENRIKAWLWKLRLRRLGATFDEGKRLK